MNVLITNNPLVETACRDVLPVEYTDEPLLSLLTRVRDLIHAGCRLLTHPLSGSLKPNETQYKTVLISRETGKTDPQSLSIIEESILTVRKFPARIIREDHLQDLQKTDLSLIQSALRSGKGSGGL